MARIKYPVRSPQRELSCIAGSFDFNGTSNPATVRGEGFTVAYTSTGTWTVTFTAEHYYQLQSATATAQLASAGDQFAQVGTYTAPTATANATLVLRVWDVSSAGVATPGTDANNRMNFVCYFKDTAV